MKSGVVLEKGDAVLLLPRVMGISDECFTRGKEFVPERWAFCATVDHEQAGRVTREERRDYHRCRWGRFSVSLAVGGGEGFKRGLDKRVSYNDRRGILSGTYIRVSAKHCCYHRWCPQFLVSFVTCTAGPTAQLSAKVILNTLLISFVSSLLFVCVCVFSWYNQR